MVIVAVVWWGGRWCGDENVWIYKYVHTYHITYSIDKGTWVLEQWKKAKRVSLLTFQFLFTYLNSFEMVAVHITEGGNVGAKMGSGTFPVNSGRFHSHYFTTSRVECKTELTEAKVVAKNITMPEVPFWRSPTYPQLGWWDWLNVNVLRRTLGGFLRGRDLDDLTWWRKTHSILSENSEVICCRGRETIYDCCCLRGWNGELFYFRFCPRICEKAEKITTKITSYSQQKLLRYAHIFK